MCNFKFKCKGNPRFWKQLGTIPDSQNLFTKVYFEAVCTVFKCVCNAKAIEVANGFYNSQSKSGAGCVAARFVETGKYFFNR